MKKITKKAYGKNIKITDARDNFDLAINNAYGNTEQDTTSGNQLFDYSGLIQGAISSQTGQEMADPNTKRTDYTSCEAETSYTLGNMSGSKRALYFDENKTLLSSDLFTTPNDTFMTPALCSYFVIQGNNSLWNEKVMLNKGTTALPFEKYTGGMASPNPSYPQEIKSVVLSEIKTCGKNLLNQSALLQGTISANDGYTIGTSTSILYSPYFTKLKRGESYIFNIRNSIRIYKYDKYKKFIKSVIVTNAFIADCEYIRYQSNNFTDESQLEIGTVSTAYEPYTESVTTLSNPITLNGFNGVWDTLESKKYGVEIFDGSDDEGWVLSPLPNSDLKRLYSPKIADKVKIPSNNNSVINLKCNQFANTSASLTYSKKEGISVQGQGSQQGMLIIYSNSYNTNDISLWKAHLASKPMEVTYELAEPIETQLPDADVEALKSLKTYDGVTHIFTDSEVKPELEVEYTLLEAKDEWNYTDYILHTDYNRIVGNINYLKAYLDTLFIGLTNISTMEEKTAKSLIYAREINAIETALETLNIETYKFDIGETKEYMANTRTLNFEDLNRIESAIFMLAEQMTSHKENLSRLAFRLGGQKGIRV